MSETEKVERLESVRLIVLAVFLVGYVALMLHLLGLLTPIPSAFWSWYVMKFELYPVRSVVVPLEIVTGTLAMNYLRKQIPGRARVTRNGGTFISHFMIQSIFWFGIILEFPLAILFTIYGVSLFVHLAAFGVLLMMVTGVFAYLWFRPKVRVKKFRGFFAPLAAMVTPGISVLNRLHMSRMLPNSIDGVIQWLLLNFQKVITGLV